MNSIRIKDKAFGKQKEITIKEIINNKFNCAVEKLPPFHCFDFKDLAKNTYFEHKGRRIEYNKYPETMVGYNKIEFIKKIQIIFIILFSDLLTEIILLNMMKNYSKHLR